MRPGPGRAPQPARVDASMDLLRTLRVEALDPSYRRAADAHGGPRTRARWLVPALVAVGLVFGLAVANTWRTAPERAREREDIIARIEAAGARHDDLSRTAADLRRELRRVSGAAGGLSAAEAARSELLGASTGLDAVSGPGVRLTLDDGPDSDVRGARVVDADLRMAVNGLWAAGAEAVSVNGRRLSVRTAIRNAGDAITVDYRSLTRPYRVEAIGDARALEDGFRASEGGRWLQGLGQHYGVPSSIERVGHLELAPDPGLDVVHASRAR